MFVDTNGTFLTNPLNIFITALDFCQYWQRENKKILNDKLKIQFIYRGGGYKVTITIKNMISTSGLEILFASRNPQDSE